MRTADDVDRLRDSLTALYKLVTVVYWHDKEPCVDKLITSPGGCKECKHNFFCKTCKDFAKAFEGNNE
jgi:hypothetical protein